MSERVSIGEAARITGIGRRTLNIRAERGEIPGAARLFDGGNWTFDAAKLRAWIFDREQAICQRTSTGKRADESGMLASKLGAENIAQVYEQLILRRHVDGSRLCGSAPNKHASPVSRATCGRKQSLSGRKTHNKASNPQP